MEDNSKINSGKVNENPTSDEESIFTGSGELSNSEDDIPVSEDNLSTSEDNTEYPDFSDIAELSDDEILNGKDFDFSNIEKIREQIAQNMPAEFQEFLDDDDDDAVVKKYNVYISKDFVPIIDNLSTNELSAYINDAIQKKIDIEDAERNKEIKKRIAGHIIVAIITAIAFTPVLLYAAHKSILATFNNYKYSQDAFEKLYSDKIKKNNVYTRSVNYSKLQKTNNKSSN